MLDMPRPRLPHLRAERNRHGNVCFYVRVGDGKRTRIRAAYGTPKFDEEYHAAIAGKPLTARRGPASGTLAWAVRLYKESSLWAELKPATQRQRANVLARVVAKSGEVELSKIGRKEIVEGRERRASTPAAARHFLDAMRALFSWAVEREIVRTNPAEEVKPPKRAATEGHKVWTEEHLIAFEDRWQIGTRERLIYEILRETGLRRGDVAVLGRQHVKDGVIRIFTEKTGQRVAIPVTARLQAALDAGPTGDLAFVACADGSPMRKESLGNLFRDACISAGVPGRAHGIRKAAATMAANAGFSEAQMEARFGWTGGRMASLYTKTMDREKLSIDAQAKLEPPAAPEKVRRASEKTSIKTNIA